MRNFGCRPCGRTVRDAFVFFNSNFAGFGPASANEFRRSMDLGNDSSPNWTSQRFTPVMAHLREPSIARTTGAHYPAINESNLREVLIVVPSLPEQRRIATYIRGLLEKLDTLKRLQDETSAKLGALLPTVLDKALKGEL